MSFLISKKSASTNSLEIIEELINHHIDHILENEKHHRQCLQRLMTSWILLKTHRDQALEFPCENPCENPCKNLCEAFTKDTNNCPFSQEKEHPENLQSAHDRQSEQI